MNISLVTINLSQGGGQRDIVVLANAFSKTGHNVKILLTEKKSSVCYEIDTKIKIICLDEYAKRELKQRGIIFKFFKKIKRFLCKNSEYKSKKLYYKEKALFFSKFILKECKNDVIISELIQANIVVGLAKRRLSNKILIREGTFPEREDYSQGFKKLRDEAYAQADLCVFQTATQMNLFSEKIKSKGVIIPNALVEGLPVFNEEACREKIIVNYGGFRAVKNLPVLLYAFIKIHKKYDDYKLFFFGGGEKKEELEKIIKDNKVESYVTLNPFCNNVHDKVKQASMFVMTSDYEGMPNSLLEAMAIGLPCISTDCDGGGARAVIENGVNGILVPKGDVDAVAKAMEDLIQHPDKAEFIAKNAIKIREELSSQKIVNMWLKIMN